MKMKIHTLVGFWLIVISAILVHCNVVGGVNPVIIPIPNSVSGTNTPTLSLNGTWKFTMDPSQEFWRNSVNPRSWADIQVPGEALMQGFNIKQDVEYPYKKKTHIPEEFSGQRIFLQFDGVYSYARVWLNGKFIRDHHGGFTTWNCEITDQVVPGESAWITVGVTDPSDAISWGSAYAKHNMGGIIRNVRMIAVPTDPITSFHAITDFDSTYTDATLKIEAAVDFTEHRQGKVMLSLMDPSGEEVALSPGSIHLTRQNQGKTVSIPIKHPKKWDAEHPNLYTLTATLKIEGEVQERVFKDIGFREVERRGNKLYVNGKPVTLRGVNRHSVHPTLGRAITDKLAKKDARLFKEANVNFVRTSHYPPTRAFLKACDQYGIYVEDESAVCFQLERRNLHTAPNEKYTSWYMNQFKEMIHRDKSHPSVIMWSLGNESSWGMNIQKEYEYAKKEDPSRPVMFSYPQTVPPGIRSYDIYSQHYYNYRQNMGHPSILYPVLHDEYGHVACYNLEELRRDPGVRNFWGHSIKRFGEDFFTTDGALGGAIWGSVDEVFQLPDLDIQHPNPDTNRRSEFGYGEWGCLIDGWRRKKPEYWLTKKAYSPIRIKDRTLGNPRNNPSPYGLSYLGNPGKEKPLMIPIENQFDHTNLKELRIEWSVNGQGGKIKNLDVAPGAQGKLVLPSRNWNSGDIIELQFYQYDTLLVDAFKLPIGQPQKKFQEVQGPIPEISKLDQEIVIKGSGFQMTFNRETGLLRRGSYNGKKLITGGPYLNLTGKELEDWKKESFKVEQDTTEVIITSKGRYGSVGVSFEIRIDGTGLMSTKYRITNPPHDQPRNGYGEVGVTYHLTNEINKLTWDRDGLYTVYPENHIGRNQGEAFKTRPDGKKQYGEKPQCPWSQDMKNFFLFGRDDTGRRGTRDFRSMKTHIWYASAIIADGNERVRVESNRQDAVRLSIQQEDKKRVLLHINTAWNYLNLGWGNYMKEPLLLRKGHEGIVSMRFTNKDEYEKVVYQAE